MKRLSSQFSALQKPATMAAMLAMLPLATQAEEMTPYDKMPAGVYAVDKTHASLIWKVSHVGLSNYTARFKAFDADITLDPSDPTKSKVVATIDPTSIETDYVPTPEKDFNQKLANDKDWFNAGQYPSIRFESTKIEVTGDKTGKIHGDLTLLGVTKPVVLDTTFNGAFEKQPFSQKAVLGFSATTSIKRSEWGFGSYVPTIGDEVAIIIEAEFVKKD